MLTAPRGGAAAAGVGEGAVAAAGGAEAAATAGSAATGSSASMAAAARAARQAPRHRLRRCRLMVTALRRVLENPGSPCAEDPRHGRRPEGGRTWVRPKGDMKL